MENVLMVLVIWVLSFYIAIVLSTRLKKIEFDFGVLIMCLLVPYFFVKATDGVVKTFCKGIKKDTPGVIIPRKAKKKLKRQLLLHTFPDFMNFYMDTLEHIQFERQKQKVSDYQEGLSGCEVVYRKNIIRERLAA